MFEEENRRSFLRKTAVTGGLLVGGVGESAAKATVYVDKNDPDAYDSIQQAVDEAPDPATVEVATGVYTESVGIPGDKSLTIRGDTGGNERGAGPDAPVIDGEGRATWGFLLEGPNTSKELVIEGIHIRNFGTDLADGEIGFGIRNTGQSNVKVRDITMSSIAGKGVDLADDGDNLSRNWTIERSRFDAIARNGIQLASIDGAVVRNNVVYASEDVPDAEGDWFERKRPSGNPVYGILLAASAGNGNSAVVRDVTVTGNELRGRYDAGAIGVFSYDYSGEQSLLENVKVRENRIELESFDYDSVDFSYRRQNHGIRIDANSGRDDRPSAIRDVTVAENHVSGAGNGIKCISWSSFRDTTKKGGIRNVEFRGNRLENCGEAIRVTTYDDGDTEAVSITGNDIVDSNTGLIAYTNRAGRATGIRFAENRIVDFDLGVVPWAQGGKLTDVDIADNEFVRNTNPKDGNLVYAVEPVAIGGELSGVRVSGSTFSKTLFGVIAFGVNSSKAEVEVIDSTFSDNGTGLATFAYDEGSSVELQAKRTTFEDNGVGVMTGRKASGDNLHVHSSDFRGNSEFAAENRNGKGVIDATCNYWGHPSGPDHDNNPGGRGDRVSDGVDYDPLLSQSYREGAECHPAGDSGESAASSTAEGGSGRDSDDRKPKAPGKPPGEPPSHSNAHRE